MKRAGILAAIVAALVIVGGAIAGDGDPTQTEPAAAAVENLERFIGADLAPDGRATRADVSWLLPQSCPPFYLRDEHGKIIDPTLDSEVCGPVSIEQTCMKCKEIHDPNRVMRGYHFQMGFDEMAAEAAAGERAPLDKGPGYYGKWTLFDQRELAPKFFDDPDAIDMTSFEWARDFGVNHPGGGPGKCDRGGRRYDRVQSEDPLMAQFQYDGDYWEARWHQTGVLEADCLICHLPGYDYSLRAQQIKKLNYRWAATEGAGLGVVEGAVADNEVPVVRYNTNLFGADGKVHLPIRRPSDRACSSCHTMAEAQKRGTAWHNPYIKDVHSDVGVSCVDCHTGDIRHNFAKGHSSNEHVRDDLDGTMQSCQECHYETRNLGAPDYAHQGIPPIHLERLSCEACHITKRPFLSCRVVDSLTGKVIQLPNPTEPVETANFLFGAFWGTLDVEEKAALSPFTADQVRAAADLRVDAGSPVRAGFLDPSVLPEEAFTVRSFIEDGADPVLVNTDVKRQLMLLALEQTTGVGEDAIVASLYRGQVNRVRKGRLIALDTALQPPRVGQIAEYPVTQMMHTVDGQDVIHPVGYQVGVFWAFEQDGEIRPVYPREMKAAWDFLESTKVPPATGETDDVALQYRLYPANPPEGDPVVIPNPAESDRKSLVKALMGRIKQYGENDWRSLGVFDDNNDMWPEVNTENEMGTVAWALARTMTRLESPTLYYIKGLSVYRVTLDDPVDPYTVETNEMAPIPEGEDFFAVFKFRWDDRGNSWRVVDVRPMPNFAYTIEPVDREANPKLAALASRLEWTISHGVEPSGQALGAKSCADCHSMDSDFFFASVLVDPFDEEGLPATVPAYELLGYTKDSLQAAAWREQWVKPYASWLVLIVFAVMALHYALIGIKQGDQTYAPDVLRFTLIERVGHLVLMLSVAYLSVTGFCFLLGVHDPLGEWSRYCHTLCGYVAAGAMIIVTLRWIGNMLPQKGDIKWLLHMGGYLGGKGHHPAHKFNAGQKILFWKAVGLMAILIASGIVMALNRGERFPEQQWVYFIHDAAAAIMILLLLGHIYLAVFVNPHSVRSLFGGMVSSVWAKEHHPDWKPKK